MSEIPTELKYLSSHEWARVENNGDLVVVGITDHAQESLGEVVYVETPEIGSMVKAGEQAGVIESVKAASDINSPVSGEVTAINTGLEDDPETVNQDPYNGGWLFKVKPEKSLQLEKELEEALDSKAYAKQIEDE